MASLHSPFKWRLAVFPRRPSLTWCRQSAWFRGGARGGLWKEGRKEGRKEASKQARPHLAVLKKDLFRGLLVRLYSLVGWDCPGN